MLRHLLSALESMFMIRSNSRKGNFCRFTSALYVTNWCACCLRPEKLVAHAAVETLAEAILHWLSRRNEMPNDPVVLRPGEHGVRGEPGPVVGDDHAGLAAPFDQRRQFPRHAPA